jgi:hypothetical protein
MCERLKQAVLKTALHERVPPLRGRVVEDLEVPEFPPKNPLEPTRLTIGVSGEGDWGTNQTPTYKAQGKIKFTLVNGFDVPIAITYTNQTGASKLADLKGVMGFAVDFAKIAARVHFRSPAPQ